MKKFLISTSIVLAILTACIYQGCSKQKQVDISNPEPRYSIDTEGFWIGDIHYIIVRSFDFVGVQNGFAVINYTSDSAEFNMNRKYGGTNYEQTQDIYRSAQIREVDAGREVLYRCGR